MAAAVDRPIPGSSTSESKVLGNSFPDIAIRRAAARMLRARA
jgi:hypothetical protein